jgi:uncharacterized membrane protein YagU involved in acid resistance
MSTGVRVRRHNRYAADRVARHAIVGVAAGLLGGLAMNVFSRVVRDDTRGRGVQPAQARRSPNADAAVKTGALVYRTVTGHNAPRSKKQTLGVAAHYSFSAAMGMTYALLATALPSVRAAFGMLYGALVWAVADEGVTPALGLSRDPRDVPLGVHVYSLCGHGVFGATLEAVSRCADSITTS